MTGIYLMSVVAFLVNKVPSSYFRGQTSIIPQFSSRVEELTKVISDRIK